MEFMHEAQNASVRYDPLYDDLLAATKDIGFAAPAARAVQSNDSAARRVLVGTTRF